MWFGRFGIGLASVFLLAMFPMTVGFETVEAEAFEIGRAHV